MAELDSKDARAKADDEPVEVPSRGAPLVATLWRWLLVSAVLGLVFTGLAQVYLDATRSRIDSTTLSDIALPLAATIVGFSVLSYLLLRSEESRLARELRTARTGTPVLRGLILGRRQKLPAFFRLFSSQLGTAAVLVAEGERGLAQDALNRPAPLLFGSRMTTLREVVRSDVDRLRGTSVDLDRTVHALQALPDIGNREADLYKVHVLVKAVLQQASGETAALLARTLEKERDDDHQIYAAWLRTWFDIDDGPPITEGTYRLAILLARSHGADELVKKLEAKLPPG